MAPFNPTCADDHFGGGRFDPMLGDHFAYCYTGLRPLTALLETLVRSLAFGATGDRVLTRAAIRGHVLGWVELTQDLTVVSLCTSEHLAAACQDGWLVQADEPEYGKTRRWGQWLRRYTDDTDAGLIWPSKRDVGAETVLLYEDRCTSAVQPCTPSDVMPLDDETSTESLKALLAPARVTIRPSSRSHLTASSAGQPRAATECRNSAPAEDC